MSNGSHYHQVRNGEYEISTDPARLDLDTVARFLTVNVRDPITVRDREVGVPIEERNHMRPRVQQSVDHRGVVAFAQLVPQIRSRQRRVFEDPGALAPTG